MTSVSAGHIILTPTQPVGSGWTQRESDPGLPHQESPALPTELPPPLFSGGCGSSAVERATPGEEVPGSIPAVAVRSLQVGSVSV